MGGFNLINNQINFHYNKDMILVSGSKKFTKKEKGRKGKEKEGKVKKEENPQILTTSIDTPL